MGLYKVFIKNLKKWRKISGISQEKLAELCNSAHSYIRQIECGSRYPSFSFIEKLANALNIAPYLLFYEEETEKSYLSEIIQISEAELIEIISRDIHTAFEKLKNAQ